MKRPKRQNSNTIKPSPIKHPENRDAFLFAITERCLTLIMIKKLLYAVILAAVLFSCNSNTKKNPVTDTEVATTFIRAVLDDDFTTAEKYLLVDETNQQYFESYRHHYQLKTEGELKQYKAADIIINEIKSQSDSVHLVDYSNTYKKEEKTNLKLVWSGGKWLIDLKYTFEKAQ